MFTPEQIPGCVMAIDFARGGLYQDAAKTIAVTADNQPIGFAPDWSGNQSDAKQTTNANRPMWRTSGLNGSPSAVTVLAGQYLEIAASPALKALDSNCAATVVAVFARYSGGGSDTYATVLSKGHYFGDTRFIFSSVSGGISTHSHGFSTTSALSETTASVGEYSLQSFTYTWHPRLADNQTGRETLYLNGRLCNAWEDVTAGTNPTQLWQLFSSAGSFNLVGEIAMVYIYNRVLTPIEMDQINGYAARYVPLMGSVFTAKSLRPTPVGNVIIAGDSLSRGLSAEGYSWCQQLEGNVRTIPLIWSNLAVSGQSIAAIANAFPLGKRTTFDVVCLTL